MSDSRQAFAIAVVFIYIDGQDRQDIKHETPNMPARAEVTIWKVPVLPEN